MEQIRDYELISLNVLRMIMHNYVSCQNIDITWSCRLLKNSRYVSNLNEVYEKALHGGVGCLVVELLVLLTELYNKDGLNCANNEFRAFFNNIKKDFPNELKNMNANEFLKTLRNSIAHNSEAITNFKAINTQKYSVHVKKKGASVESDKIFSKEQLLRILEIYDKHKILEKHFGFFNFQNDDSDVDSLLKKHKKDHTFNEAIQFYDKNGNLKPMDKFQESAFYRYLQKNRTTLRKSSDVEYSIMRFYPHTDNKFNHYENKYHLTTAFDMLCNHKDITCSKFVKILQKKDQRSVMPFIDNELMQATMMSSIAFNLFSARTAAEIKALCHDAGLEMDEETLNHLRNSFIHGRYFYNYNNAFEIYDGTSTLSHITTVSCDTLNKLIDIICRPQFDKANNRRIQELNNMLAQVKESGYN